MEKNGVDENKKQYLIFLAAAFLLPYLLGLPMGLAYWRGVDVSLFPNAQMFYPAAGVILALFFTRKGDPLIPGRFFILYLVTAAAMLLAALVSIWRPGSFPLSVVNLLMILGSLIGWLFLLTDGKEKRKAYGLRGNCWGRSFLFILLFVVLYVLRYVIIYAVTGELGTLAQIAGDSMTWLMVAVLPLNLFLVFLPFFGEEYGWRYYLQPILQKRFGLKRGVFLLGVVWGIWHMPINFFYYSSPTNGLMSVLGQLITCVTLGIFLAFVYMRTDNIWVPVTVHFLNNNLIPIMAGNYSAEVLQGNEVTWAALGINLVLGGVLFGSFILSKAFKKGAKRLPTAWERAEEAGLAQLASQREALEAEAEKMMDVCPCKEREEN